MLNATHVTCNPYVQRTAIFKLKLKHKWTTTTKQLKHVLKVGTRCQYVSVHWIIVVLQINEYCLHRAFPKQVTVVPAGNMMVSLLPDGNMSSMYCRHGRQNFELLMYSVPSLIPCCRIIAAG